MGRSFQVDGPVLVQVRGGQHWYSGGIGGVTELGLSQEPIKIDLKRDYKDLHADDLGDRAAADVMAMQGECEIEMKLIHFDRQTLACCVSDSMAGTPMMKNKNFRFAADRDFLYGKIQQPTGSLLGNGLPRFASGNYYVGLNLQAGERFFTVDLGINWRFFYAYLAEQPVVTRVGSEARTVELRWRAIRYSPLWQVLKNVKSDGTFVSTSLGDAAGAGQDPAVTFPFHRSTVNSPPWVEQRRNFPLRNGQARIYTLMREQGTDPSRYVLPLWDHDQDDDSSDGVHQ